MRTSLLLPLVAVLLASSGASKVGKRPLAPPAKDQEFNPHRDGTRFGRSVLVLSDLDGDGMPEIAVGAPTWPGGGAVLVLSGKTRAQLALWRGTERLSTFGHGLRDMGDVDGDGVGDVLVGRENTAQCEIWSGAKGEPLLLLREPFDRVHSVGDVNGDGLGDHVVTRPEQWTLHAGPKGEILRQWNPGVSSKELQHLGDIDGDGLADFFIGLSSARLLLSEAKTDGFPDYAYADAPRIRERWSALFGGGAVHSRGAAAGDLDDDGRTDVVVACNHQKNAFVIGLGLDNQEEALMRTLPVEVNKATYRGGQYRFGYELICPGDLDGDGYGDVVAANDASVFMVSITALNSVTGRALWKADWSDGGAASAVTLASYVDADGDGVEDILAGSSDWWWHGVVVPNGTVRLLSGATGKPLWVVGERRYRPGGVGFVPEAEKGR